MRLLCYCESRLQVQIASTLRTGGASVEVLLANWTSDVGQFDAAEALGLSVTMGLPLPDNMKRLAAVRFCARVALTASRADALVLFQDQSAVAWHVALAAKDVGLKRILIQDGFLSFALPASRFGELLRASASRLWTGDTLAGRPGFNLLLYDRLFGGQFFGHSKPDLTIVHGDEMAERLKRYFRIPDDRVVAVGPLFETGWEGDQQLPSRGHEAFRFVFLAQPSLSYGRISERGWKEEYLPLVEALTRSGGETRMHPSQSAVEQADLARIVPRAQLIGVGAPLTGQDLAAYDCVVTVSSTGFIQARSRNIPVVTVALSSALDSIPRIVDDLVYSAISAEDAVHAVTAMRRDGQFPKTHSANRGVSLESLFTNWRSPLEKRVAGALRAIERVAPPHTRA